MKIYYAHCLSIYNTPQEARDILTLKALGFDVLNPNSHEHEGGYKVRGMDYFTDLVWRCDALAFRALPDGSIPAGISHEIEAAQKKSMPIIELPSRIIGRGLSVEATREFLAQCGQR